MKNNDNFYTLISGATGGLGQAFVYVTLKQNQNLILLGTNEEKLTTLKKSVEKEYPNANIITFKCDYSSNQDINSLFDFLSEKKIKVNLLINNAGLICEGSEKHTSYETIEKCITINNIATSKVTKFIIENRPSSHLDIITISSLASNYPLPFMALYASTKAYLKNYMLALREEYKKDNINILTVLPGAIATSDDMKKAIEAQGLKGKLSAVSPKKIAQNSLKKVRKNKPLYIPGWFNKLTNIVSKITPLSVQIKVAGKMWKKSQAKRNIK